MERQTSKFHVECKKDSQSSLNTTSGRFTSATRLHHCCLCSVALMVDWLTHPMLWLMADG